MEEKLFKDGLRIVVAACNNEVILENIDGAYNHLYGGSLNQKLVINRGSNNTVFHLGEIVHPVSKRNLPLSLRLPNEYPHEEYLPGQFTQILHNDLAHFEEAHEKGYNIPGFLAVVAWKNPKISGRYFYGGILSEDLSEKKRYKLHEEPCKTLHRRNLPCGKVELYYLDPPNKPPKDASRSNKYTHPTSRLNVIS